MTLGHEARSENFKGDTDMLLLLSILWVFCLEIFIIFQDRVDDDRSCPHDDAEHRLRQHVQEKFMI